jgi:hypothetical protein
MANESTYNTISSLVPSIMEASLITARELTSLPTLVRNFSGEGLTPRVFSSYTGGTIVTLAEITDMSAQTFTPAAYGTVTPAIWSAQYYITDARIASDFNGVRLDASNDFGKMFAQKANTSVSALFSSLTGGTVGSAGGTLTFANVMRASAYVRAANAGGQQICVVRPEQWYYLTSPSSGVPTLLQSPEWMNSLAANWYQGSWGGIAFFVSNDITSGTAAVGALFNPEAMAFDVRKPFGIEVQRDASRGGGGYELNATMWAGAGVYRPTFGCEMIGTSV